MAPTERYCFAVLLAGVVAAASSLEESAEHFDSLCRDHGIGCSPGGAIDTSAESSFEFDDLFRDLKSPVQVDTHIPEDSHKEAEHPVVPRDDQYKEIDHPVVDIISQITEELHKEINHPDDIGSQIREIDHPVDVITQFRDDFHKEIDHPVDVINQPREDFHKELEHTDDVVTQIREDIHKESNHPAAVITEIRDDFHKEIDHPVDIINQFREDFHKEIDHPVDVVTQFHNDQTKEIEKPVSVVNTQVQFVPENVGNQKAPETAAEVVIVKEPVREIVKNPDSGTSNPKDESPASVVAIKVPVTNDTTATVGSTDMNMKGTDNGVKKPANWPNSLLEFFGNIPAKQTPHVSINGNSYYTYQEPGDNGKMEVFSYWGPGAVDVIKPPKKPPAPKPKPKPKPENPIINVGSSLLREIVRVPLAIKADLERYARKLLKFTGKGVKGLIKEGKRIILKIHGFFRDGTNVIITKIDEMLRYVITLLSESK